MITDQSEDLSRWQSFFSSSVLNYGVILGDLFHTRFEQGLHLARFDSILNVGAHPILDGCAEIFLPMHQRHPRAISKQVERGLRGGIFPAHHHDVLIPEFVTPNPPPPPTPPPPP